MTDRKAKDMSDSCGCHEWSGGKHETANDEHCDYPRVVRELEEAVGLLRSFMKFPNPVNNGDWACRECKPLSDMLVDGFQCFYHCTEAFLAAHGGINERG